jgi:hypothetical protein
MEKPVLDALRAAAEAAHCIDPDVVVIPEFSEAAGLVQTGADGTIDPASVQAAISKMRETKPAFFRQRDFAKMGPARFAEAETALLESTRKPRSIGSEIPKGLDYSTLSDREFQQADRYLRGATNDASVFRRHAKSDAS